MPEWRRGAARVYAHNWADHPTGQCEAGLRRLFDDLDVEARRQVAWTTPRLRPEHAVRRQEFLWAFAASRAARSAAHDVAEFLWAHRPLDPVWALSVVEAVLANERCDDEHPGFSGGEDLVRQPHVQRQLRVSACS